jgi:hypothetical protein
MKEEASTDETVRDWIRELIREEDFQPPLFITSVGINGGMMHSSVTWAEKDGVLQTSPLADHYPDGEIAGLRSPVNIMVTDKTGRSAHLGTGPLEHP